MLMDTLRATHPGVVFTLHPAIGEVDGVVAAMADVALALTKAGTDPSP